MTESDAGPTPTDAQCAGQLTLFPLSPETAKRTTLEQERQHHDPLGVAMDFINAPDIDYYSKPGASMYGVTETNPLKVSDPYWDEKNKQQQRMD